MNRLALACFFLLLVAAGPVAGNAPKSGGTVHVGAAAVEMAADDSMILAGSILPTHARGQEGKLRAVAVVLEKPGDKPTRLALVACDVIAVTRDLIDPVAEEIERKCGIPPSHLLVNATHTHHAPSTVAVHAYGRDEIFCRNMQKAIVRAVVEATAKLKTGESRLHFRLGEESTVGQNSRQLLKDNTIYWIGPRDDFVRPTGPFDPELPVLAFRGVEDKKLRGLVFNHSTHTIGARRPGVRSPSFYGLACQELEESLGAPVCFLEGASGSTHNLFLKTDEMVVRMKQAVLDALEEAEPRPVDRLAASRRKFTFKVRRFDEAKEEDAVSSYCKKRGERAEPYVEAFRKQRKMMAPHQGEERTTYLQAMVIGDVAVVGVPAEFFTKHGQDVKRRSPYRYTYVAELANDYIGYIPDRKAMALGGYQTWTGLHSYAETGTGEAIVAETIKMLQEMHDAK